RSIIVDLPTLTTPLAGRVLQAIWLRCLLLGAARQTRRRQILAVADEFQSGAAIDTWREALATGRDYGFGVALISQAIPNLAAAFSRAQADALLELFGTLVFCRNSCVHTNRYASEKSGTYRTNDQPGVPVPELRPEAFSRLEGPSKWRVDCEAVVVKDGRASPVVFRRSRRPAKRFGYRMRRAKWALITMMAALFTPQGRSVFAQTTAFITSLTEDRRSRDFKTKEPKTTSPSRSSDSDLGVKDSQ
ncbi:MAG: type IV secretory system conjugative DNA transfer family protein, partial [Planctomycetota bacterium]